MASAPFICPGWEQVAALRMTRGPHSVELAGGEGTSQSTVGTSVFPSPRRPEGEFFSQLWSLEIGKELVASCHSKS